MTLHNSLFISSVWVLSALEWDCYFFFSLSNHFGRILMGDLFQKGEICWEIVLVFTNWHDNAHVHLCWLLCMGKTPPNKCFKHTSALIHLCSRAVCLLPLHSSCLIFIARDTWNSWHCGKIKQLLLSVSWCI